MQFERLKKNHKKEILIGGMILVCVISAITITTTRAKYKLTEDIKLASGTINYKPYDFKIMAMYQENDSGTYSEITTMPESGYIVNEEKSYCTTDNKTQVKNKLSTNSDGEHIFKNLSKSDKCYVWFDKVVPITVDTIIATNNPKTTTPAFSSVAKTDEGVFKVEDGMYGGHSYYWRGAATTNHVIFANMCWRIVRINGDKSIRLIYNGSASSGTCSGNGINAGSIAKTSQKYNTSSNQSNYVGWTYTGTSQRTTSGTSSNAKKQTESWYNEVITGTNEEKVATGYFCNDRNVQSGDTWAINGNTFYYAAYKRAYTDYKPTLSCPDGDKYTLKVGAITADEVMYAGGRSNAENKQYYLYNGQNYWTMSPFLWYSDSTSFVQVFRVSASGYLYYWTVDASDGTGIGLRPVINLNSNVKFNSGSDGTQNNPYIVQ